MVTPDALTIIEDHAFCLCPGITSFILGRGIETLEIDAIYGCSSLSEVHVLAENPPTLGADMFYGSPSQLYIYVPFGRYAAYRDAGWDYFRMTEVIPDTATGTCGDNVTFTFTKSTGLLEINGSGDMIDYYRNTQVPWSQCILLIKSVRIDEGITSIGNFAFCLCENLTSITVPSSVNRISHYAFYDCASLKSFTIPSAVTQVGDYAFYKCSDMTSIGIGESVSSIGQEAFSECPALTTVTLESNDIVSKPYSSSSTLSNIFGSQIKKYMIGDKVTSIGDYAFYKTDSLTSVTVGNGVTSIGDCAFYKCTNLPSVTLGNAVTSIGDNAFRDCSGLTSITIPNSVTSIGDNAFRDCSGLTSITIPNSVTSIGNLAFAGCSGLTSVAIPNSVTSLGYRAFVYCSSLTSVAIPNSVTSLGSRAFAYCSSLTSVTIPESITRIESYLFSGCDNLTSVIIPNSVTSIEEGAFYECSALTSINIGEKVDSIGDYAFYGCSNVKEMYVLAAAPPVCGTNVFYHVPTRTCELHVPYNAFSAYKAADQWERFFNIEKIIPDVSQGKCGDNATFAFTKSTGQMVIEGKGDMTDYADIKDVPWYELCDMIKSVTIAKGITSLGDYAFANCANLSSVSIPKSVQRIGDLAFGGCKSLTSVTIPNSVQRIGDSAFGNCRSLTSINIPSSVTYIGDYAFGFCTALISATISGNITDINEGTFNYCTKLASVTLPGSVTSIESHAFYNCTSLTSFPVLGSVTSIGEMAFSDCTSLSSFPVLSSLTSIGIYAFENCTSLTSFTLGKDVNSIGLRAFYNCSAIEEMYSLAQVAPTCNTSEFLRMSTKTCVLYVPFASTGSYRSTGWREFKNIKEMIPEVASGKCGDDVTYTFTKSTGHLEIKGKGAMTAFSNQYEFPWYGARDLIKSISFSDSITNIPDAAFKGCSSLTDVTNFAVKLHWVSFDAFDNSSDRTLHVLPGTKAEYESSIVWREFHIVEDAALPSAINSVKATVSDQWYHLNGVPVDKPTRKGIYIHNGKKVFVK